MHRILGKARFSAPLLLAALLVACGRQEPAPVVYTHRGSTAAQGSQLAVQSVPAPAAAVTVAPEAAPDTVIVQPGDTVYALSRRHNRPVRAIIDDNGLQPPYLLQPGQQLRMPGGRFHTVQRGETLYSISRSYGADLYSIAQANNLSPPYAIEVGQQLRISTPTAYAVASAAPVAASLPSSRGIDVETLPPPTPSPSTAPPAQPSATVLSVPDPMPEPASAPAAAPAPLPEVTVPKPAGTPPVVSEPPSSPQPVPANPQIAAAPVPPVTPQPPSSAPPAPERETVLPPRSGRTFSWPVRGRILSNFGPKADGLHNDGINIAARAGAPVIAAENGVVVYSGSELRGFGNLLLVRHADGWITAYAHLDKTLVRKGQKVTRGQAIGTVGTSGGVSEPQLHFEIRRGTQAVDPAKFLSVV